MGAIAGAAIAGAAIIGGGILGNKEARRAQAYDANLQREFAQYGIQWRVADAEKAGVHPLYAINANVPTYAPTRQAGGHLGRGIAAAGQAIGDYLTQQERRDQARKEQGLRDEHMRLQNQRLRAEIAGQQIENRNRNRQATAEVNQTIQGQQTGGFWTGPGSPRIYHHSNPLGRPTYYVLEPGQAGHQQLEDSAGNIYAEAVSTTRALRQRGLRKKYGPHGGKRWSEYFGRVKEYDDLPPARRRRKFKKKKPPARVPKRLRRSPFRHLQR